MKVQVYKPVVNEVFGNYLAPDAQLMKTLGRLIEQHYKHMRKPAYYCKALNVSLRVLNRLCLQYYGETVYEHVQGRVHAEIIKLLKHTTLTVKQIAHELGICDYRYLCRDFKRRTGMRPMEFRKKNRLLLKPI